MIYYYQMNNGYIPEERGSYMKYKILSQFVKTDARFDANVQEAVKAGIVNYNSRSLIAKNPKKITDYSFTDDELTLEIILESDEALPMPSKALRLLSTYLVNETSIGEGDYLAGKQLFKMTSSEVESDTIVNSNDETKVEADIDRMARLAKYMELLQKAGASMRPELDSINEQIEILVKKLN